MKTIFAPKAVIEKWLSALRSGEYTQGTGGLHWEGDDSYCCLGVLQHCLTGETEGTPTPSFGWLERNGVTFMDYRGFTDTELARTVSPYLPTLGRSAWAANDQLRCRFDEIADAIEACVEYTDEATA